MKLETLLLIKAENDRFTKRLNAAIDVANHSTYRLYNSETRSYTKVNSDECANCNEAGALKRSALDLKMVLTKITRP